MSLSRSKYIPYIFYISKATPLFPLSYSSLHKLSQYHHVVSNRSRISYCQLTSLSFNSPTLKSHSWSWTSNSAWNEKYLDRNVLTSFPSLSISGWCLTRFESCSTVQPCFYFDWYYGYYWHHHLWYITKY